MEESKARMAGAQERSTKNQDIGAEREWQALERTLMTKLYGHNYFGKQGITSKKTERDKRKRINLKDIELNIEKYGKKTGNSWHLDLPDYKILDAEEDYNVKNKMIIKGMAASASASEKVKKAGGEIVVSKKVNENKKKADED